MLKDLLRAARDRNTVTSFSLVDLIVDRELIAVSFNSSVTNAGIPNSTWVNEFLLVMNVYPLFPL